MSQKSHKAQVRYGTKIAEETVEKKEVAWGGRLAAAVVITLVIVFGVLWFTPFGQTFLGALP